MKILLIHKFHYMLGGTETFHYNLAEALTAAGHEVIFFSMYDERNIPCAQDKYFVSNVDYNDPNLSTFKKIKMGMDNRLCEGYGTIVSVISFDCNKNYRFIILRSNYTGIMCDSATICCR